MKPNSRIITIPKPCHEDWDAMTPAQQGRHCATCQKTVVDFTMMTDGQVLDVLKSVGSQPLCGHFTADQLERTLVDTRYHPSFIKKISIRAAAMLLLLQSATSAVFAQQVKKQGVKIQQQNKNKRTDNRWPIKGRVVDSVTHKPVAGVGIQLVGTVMDTLTDKDGAFTFMLSALPTAPMVLQKHIDGHNKTAVAPKTVSITEIREGKAIIMYGRLDDTTEDVIVTTYQKPLIDKYRHSTLVTGDVKRAPSTFTGDIVAQAPGIYKQQRGKSLDTTNQISSGVSGSIDNAPMQGSSGIDMRQTKETFWQRMTHPFRRKKSR